MVQNSDSGIVLSSCVSTPICARQPDPSGFHVLMVLFIGASLSPCLSGFMCSRASMSLAALSMPHTEAAEHGTEKETYWEIGPPRCYDAVTCHLSTTLWYDPVSAVLEPKSPIQAPWLPRPGSCTHGSRLRDPHTLPLRSGPQHANSPCTARRTHGSAQAGRRSQLCATYHQRAKILRESKSATDERGRCSLLCAAPSCRV